VEVVRLGLWHDARFVIAELSANGALMALVRVEKAPIQSNLLMSLNNVQNIDGLIGRAVLSVQTANKGNNILD
jgi:hypothetical protein